jgi:hypothetical protein
LAACRTHASFWQSSFAAATYSAVSGEHSVSLAMPALPLSSPCKAQFSLAKACGLRALLGLVNLSLAHDEVHPGEESGFSAIDFVAHRFGHVLLFVSC